MLASLAHHRAPVHRTQPCDRLLAQKDVFSNGELLDHAQFLVDHPDAGRDRIAGGMEAYLLPIQAHRALILRMYAGDDLHQCALARAVFANQAVNLSGTERKIDPIQCDGASKLLGDICQL